MNIEEGEMNKYRKRQRENYYQGENKRYIKDIVIERGGRREKKEIYREKNKEKREREGNE